MPNRVGSSLVNMRSFDGAARAEAGLLEGAHGFEPAEHADGAVVHAGVGDGVGVGAGADGGEGGVGALPADEGVADGVGADGEAGVSARAVSQARAWRSRGVKTMRVTAWVGAGREASVVGGQSVRVAR